MKKSKKGISLLGVIVVIIVIIGTPILLLNMNKGKDDNKENTEYGENATSNVVLKVYKEGTDKVINTLNITDGEKAKKVQEINENMKSLPKADVKLAVAREWEITIDEDILISGNFSEDYCYYFNNKENISKLVKRPENLNQLLDEIL